MGSACAGSEMKWNDINNLGDEGMRERFVCYSTLDGGTIRDRMRLYEMRLDEMSGMDRRSCVLNSISVYASFSVHSGRGGAEFSLIISCHVYQFHSYPASCLPTRSTQHREEPTAAYVYKYVMCVSSDCLD